MPSSFTPPDRKTLAAIHPQERLEWYDYADAWLNWPLGKVLDCGCGVGAFLGRLVDRSDARWGVDMDAERLDAVRDQVDATLIAVRPNDPLPFDDGFFDTVVLMEVIEHVEDEAATLAELSRVLAPGGHLLLTTPHKGLLTFLDHGNFKFIVPGLHRFVHCTILRRGDYYEERFGSGRREKGMVADFSTGRRPWHRHYRYDEIRGFAPDDLKTVAWEAYYPAFRALWTLRVILKVATFGLVRKLPPPLGWLWNRLSRIPSRHGDQLVMLFQKRPAE